MRLIPSLASTPAPVPEANLSLYHALQVADRAAQTALNGTSDSTDAGAARKEQILVNYKAAIQRMATGWIMLREIAPSFRDSADGGSSWYSRLWDTMSSAGSAIANAPANIGKVVMQAVSEFFIYLTRLLVFKILIKFLFWAAAVMLETQLFFVGLTAVTLVSPATDKVFWGQVKPVFISAMWMPMYALGLAVFDRFVMNNLIRSTALGAGLATQGADTIGAVGAHMGAMAGVNVVLAVAILSSLGYLVFSGVWAYFSFKATKALVSGEGVAGKLVGAAVGAVGTVALAGLALAAAPVAAAGGKIAAAGAAMGGKGMAGKVAGTALSGAGSALKGTAEMTRGALGMQDLTFAQTARATAFGVAKAGATGQGASGFLDGSGQVGKSQRAQNEGAMAKKEREKERQEDASAIANAIATRFSVDVNIKNPSQQGGPQAPTPVGSAPSAHDDARNSASAPNNQRGNAGANPFDTAVGGGMPASMQSVAGMKTFEELRAHMQSNPGGITDFSPEQRTIYHSGMQALAPKQRSAERVSEPSDHPAPAPAPSPRAEAAPAGSNRA
jgi:hypothetical protein